MDETPGSELNFDQIHRTPGGNGMGSAAKSNHKSKRQSNNASEKVSIFS